MRTAQQRGGGEVGKAGPIGYVEAGARMDAFGGGGVVLPGKSFDDQATRRVPFRTGGAGPIDEKTLAADRAADVTFGVGDPAENLHGMGNLAKKNGSVWLDRWDFDVRCSMALVRMGQSKYACRLRWIYERKADSSASLRNDNKQV